MNELHAQALLDRMHGTLGGFYAGTMGVVAVRELFTPDVAWHVPGHNAIAGDYFGVDEVLDYLVRRRDIASGTFRMHPRETLTGDQGHVGVLTDGTATIAGVEHHWATLNLYRFVGDRIAECLLLPLDPRAFDLVWRA